MSDENGGAVVDLLRVRAALALLDDAVSRGVRPVPAELVAALVAAEDARMSAPATVAIGVRLPAAILARVDAVAESGALGKLPAWSRNAVILAALEAGLPKLEREVGLDPPVPPADQGDTTAELVATLRRLLGKLDPPAERQALPEPADNEAGIWPELKLGEGGEP